MGIKNSIFDECLSILDFLRKWLLSILFSFSFWRKKKRKTSLYLPHLEFPSTPPSLQLSNSAIDFTNSRLVSDSGAGAAGGLKPPPPNFKQKIKEIKN